MAKKLRRFLALVLALALCAGQLTVGVSATEGTAEGDLQLVSEMENPIENGVEKITVEVNVATGETQTTTNTTTQDPASGDTKESTKVETEVTTSTPTQTDVQKEWNETSEVKSQQTETDGTVKTEEVDTVTTGEETQSSTNIVLNENTQRTVNEISGEEATESTTTLTTTQTEEDQLLYQETVNDPDQTTEIEAETTIDKNVENEADWTKGQETTQQDWTATEEIQQGDINESRTEETPGSSQTIAVDEPNKDVTLNLPPGAADSEKTSVDSSAETVIGADQIEQYREDGYTITEKTDSKGNVIGYVATKTTTEDPVKTDITGETDNDWVQEGKIQTQYAAQEDYQSILDAEEQNKKENQTKTYTPIYDPIDTTKIIGYEITTVTTEATPSEPVNGSSDRATETVSGDLTEANEDGYLLPQRPAESSSTDADGNTTAVTVADLITDDGKHIGYTVTETVTDKDGNVTTTTRDLTGTPVEAATEENSGFVLPQKPVAGANETVENLYDEEGNHVGYTVISKVYSEDGMGWRSYTRNVYGTSSSTTVDVTTDPTHESTTSTKTITTTEVQQVFITDNTRDMVKTDTRTQNYDTKIITDEETYQMVQTEDGNMYFLYQGKMYQVQAITSGENAHGGIDLDPIQPDSDLINVKDGSSQDIYNRNASTSASQVVNSTNPNNYGFEYVGNGVASTLRIHYNNGSNTYTRAHQFALKGADGQTHYVYCCDLDTSARTGYHYDMENLENADYLTNSPDAVDHIKAIAMNGYWGVENEGTANDPTFGSLEAVKKLLRDNGYGNVADSLTHGQAVAATQAAIWKYGHSESKTKLNENNLVKANSWYGDHYNSETDAANVETLYNLLISDNLKENTPDTATQIINEDSIVGSDLTIKEKVEPAQNDTYYEPEEEESVNYYNTDLTLKFEVEKNAFTGNMEIVIKQGNKVLKEVKLRTEDSNLWGKLTADNGTTYGSTYTIKDIVLAEGVYVDVQLNGYQELEKGVYLYTSEVISEKTVKKDLNDDGDKKDTLPSQTFVGVAEGQRNVNLSTGLEFTVQDPSIRYSELTTTEYREDMQEEQRVLKRQDTLQSTKTITSGDILEENTHVTDVYGIITVTKTETEETKQDREWANYMAYDLTTVSGDDGDEDEDEGGKRKPGKKVKEGDLTIIEEEKVPLASAPKTGDISLLWASLSLISLGGFLMLAKKKEG